MLRSCLALAPRSVKCWSLPSQPRLGHLVVSAIEHKSVLVTAQELARRANCRDCGAVHTWNSLRARYVQTQFCAL